MNYRYLRQLNHNLLLALHVLLDQQGVSKAAQSLGCTQSALSHNLAALREHFEDPLLVMNGRKMVRTPFGDELLEHTRLALNALEVVFKKRNHFEPQTSSQTFKVAASITAFWLPRLLEVLRRDAPGVNVQVVAPLGSDDVARALRLDTSVALGIDTPQRSPELLYKPLPGEPFRVVLGRPLDDQGPMTLESYCAMDHVLLAPYGGSRGLVDEVLSAHGRKRRVRATVAHFGALSPLLTTEPLSTTLPTRAAQWLAAHHNLHTCSPPIELPTLKPVLIWHKRTAESPEEIGFRGLRHAVLTEGDPTPTPKPQ